jgi:hypothetical protein
MINKELELKKFEDFLEKNRAAIELLLEQKDNSRIYESDIEKVLKLCDFDIKPKLMSENEDIKTDNLQTMYIHLFHSEPAHMRDMLNSIFKNSRNWNWDYPINKIKTNDKFDEYDGEYIEDENVSCLQLTLSLEIKLLENVKTIDEKDLLEIKNSLERYLPNDDVYNFLMDMIYEDEWYSVLPTFLGYDMISYNEYEELSMINKGKMLINDYKFKSDLEELYTKQDLIHRNSYYYSAYIDFSQIEILVIGEKIKFNEVLNVTYLSNINEVQNFEDNTFDDILINGMFTPELLEPHMDKLERILKRHREALLRILIPINDNKSAELESLKSSFLLNGFTKPVSDSFFNEFKTLLSLIGKQDFKNIYNMSFHNKDFRLYDENNKENVLVKK